MCTRILGRRSNRVCFLWPRPESRPGYLLPAGPRVPQHCLGEQAPSGTPASASAPARGREPPLLQEEERFQVEIFQMRLPQSPCHQAALSKNFLLTYLCLWLLTHKGHRVLCLPYRARSWGNGPRGSPSRCLPGTSGQARGGEVTRKRARKEGEREREKAGKTSGPPRSLPLPSLLAPCLTPTGTDKKDGQQEAREHPSPGARFLNAVLQEKVWGSSVE